LVSSAKGSYDTERSEVIQMAAKVAFLDRLLAVYGPEAAEARVRFHDVVKEAVQQMWPDQTRRRAQLAPNAQAGNVLYRVIQALAPMRDAKARLKEKAFSVGIDIGQFPLLLVAQGVPSISSPLLIILVSCLAIIFLGFSALAPPNITPMLALIVSAVAVSGAIFLILELDQPFSGVIRIPSEPMVNALHQVGK